MAEPEFLEIVNTVDSAMETAGNGLIADYIPVFKYIPTPAKSKTIQMANAIVSYIERQLAEHMQLYSADITYSVLRTEKEVSQDEGKILRMFTPQHYSQMLRDIFLGGTETTRHTMYWLLKYMAMYPEVQVKVHKEIDDVLGSRKVKVSDRDKMPYTYAVLHEVMRVRPVASLGLVHMATEDLVLDGYDIPKGTYIVGNIYQSHRNPVAWPDPEEFRPERFIDEARNFVTHTGWLPFSAGKRVCVGEAVARIDLHLCMVTLFQQFSVLADPHGRQLDCSYDVSHTPLEIVSERYKIVFLARE